eukprot:2478677-Amphidinium_carterae.2
MASLWRCCGRLRPLRASNLLLAALTRLDVGLEAMLSSTAGGQEEKVITLTQGADTVRIGCTAKASPALNKTVRVVNHKRIRLALEQEEQACYKSRSQLNLWEEPPPLLR